jgi:ubiquinone/menaquinone biosynthesis C-methylase UbiE
MASSQYVHRYEDQEAQRLIVQAAFWREPLILDGTHFAPGTRLLEVGCGVGAALAELGTAFPGLALTGVDIEATQLERTRGHLAERGVASRLVRADGTELPFPPANFDHVWMMWFLEHVDSPVAALHEARRVAGASRIPRY